MNFQLAHSDIVDVAFASNGSAAIARALPSDPVLVGATFRSQMLPIAIDASGNLLAVTSTNALAMTIGAF